MRRAVFAPTPLFVALALVLLTLLTSPAAWAKIEIRDITATYTALGPERPASLEIVPGDEVFFRYTIVGVRTDATGSAQGELRLQVTDSAGKSLIDNTEPIGGLLAFGGQTLPGTAQVTFGPETTPGEYRLIVTITDKIGKETASFERKLTCLKPTFGLVQMGFTYDKEGNIPAAVTTGGVLGQTLYIQCKAVGFERTKAKPHVIFTIQALDAADGKPLLPKPVQADFAPDDPKQIADLDLVNFTGMLVLNRVGAFRLQITATDAVTKKKSEFTTPMRVSAP